MWPSIGASNPCGTCRTRAASCPTSRSPMRTSSPLNAMPGSTASTTRWKRTRRQIRRAISCSSARGTKRRWRRPSRSMPSTPPKRKSPPWRRSSPSPWSAPCPSGRGSARRKKKGRNPVEQQAEMESGQAQIPLASALAAHGQHKAGRDRPASLYPHRLGGR